MHIEAGTQLWHDGARGSISPLFRRGGTDGSEEGGNFVEVRMTLWRTRHIHPSIQDKREEDGDWRAELLKRFDIDLGLGRPAGQNERLVGNGGPQVTTRGFLQLASLVCWNLIRGRSDFYS